MDFSILTNDSSALDTFFRIITEFGSEWLYIIIIPPIYWCVNKKLGFRLFLITTLAGYISMLIKTLVKLPRPTERLWKVPPESYAFPSGHAHGSTSFWVYLMMYFRTKVLIILGIVIIALIAISRVYLGVHYPGDVYGGLALGFGTVAVFIFLDPWLSSKVQNWNLGRKLIVGTIIPLLLFLYAGFHYNYDPQGVKLSGALLGLVMGYLFETEFINLSTHVTWGTKAVRIVTGLFLSASLYFGLGSVLPQNVATCFILAWLGGFSVMFIAPMLFKKLETGNSDILSEDEIRG